MAPFGYEVRPRFTDPPLVSSVRVYPAGGHVRIHVWVNGARSGELIVREEEADRLLSLLIPGPQLTARLPESLGDLIDDPAQAGGL
jgi:hypothetical protein